MDFPRIITKNKGTRPTLYRWMQKGKLQARRATEVSHKGIWLITADEQELYRLQTLRTQPKQWIYHSRVEKVN